jgi:hypothetical protein
MSGGLPNTTPGFARGERSRSLRWEISGACLPRFPRYDPPGTRRCPVAGARRRAEKSGVVMFTKVRKLVVKGYNRKTKSGKIIAIKPRANKTYWKKSKKK